MLYQNILGLIGNTPTVKINKLNENKKVNIYIKLEGQNIGGSIKDRVALAMIEAAEKRGELTRQKIILEPTSGNTGIGLAMIAVIKGYKTTLIMSSSVSAERIKIIKAYGAEIILTSKEGGTDGSIRIAHEMLAENPDKYWMPNQYANLNNPGIHYETTAEEILIDVPDVTHFVAALGTSGTITGTSKKLREKRKNIKIIAVEPVVGHKLAGLKNMKEAIVPDIYEEEIFDEKITVTDEDANQTTREVARNEGLFLGMSSGAALSAALKLAENLEYGNIVVISPDRGEKYTSTNLFG